MKNILFIAAMALLFASCKKNDCNQNDGPTPQKTDRFVFGLSGGLCGMCYHYYELKDGYIYPDSTHTAAGWLFSAVPMSQAKYNLALPLQNSVPAYLTNNPNTTYGCNGCADQRVFYIEVMSQGVKTYWYIDDVTATIPSAVKPYTDQMRDVIEQLAN